MVSFFEGKEVPMGFCRLVSVLSGVSVEEWVMLGGS
jgi:hypothetical protein